ncbi:hypothetical protein SMALA_2291 [Streptomyces malaysiensis subsp. malaysiensis]|nr:hypothetical protein SMALA_2291 [Streptomyces malaysiensis]
MVEAPGGAVSFRVEKSPAGDFGEFRGGRLNVALIPRLVVSDSEPPMYDLERTACGLCDGYSAEFVVQDDQPMGGLPDGVCEVGTTCLVEFEYPISDGRGFSNFRRNRWGRHSCRDFGEFPVCPEQLVQFRDELRRWPLLPGEHAGQIGVVVVQVAGNRPDAHAPVAKQVADSLAELPAVHGDQGTACHRVVTRR